MKSVAWPFPPRRRNKKRGAITLMLAAVGVGMFGVAGLAFDLAWFYVVKNELQNFTDAASIAAAYKLDGTLNGVDAAKSRVQSDTNKWLFGTADVGDIVVGFGTAAQGPFEAAPAVGSGYRFVRVTAAAEPQTFFLRAIPGVGDSTLVRSSAVAGQMAMPGGGDGTLPFSPDAHDPNDITGNYGFLLGRQYTLRWDNRVGGTAPPDSFKTSVDGVELVGCDADMTSAGFQPGETSQSQRGYIDLMNLNPIGGGGGAALIKNIVTGSVSFEYSIVPGQYWVVPEPGEKQSVLSALDDRVAQDTDPTTPTYFTAPQTAPGVPSAETMNSAYRNATTYAVGEPRPPLGNGRRVGVVPVNDPLNGGVVLGFAGFLLPPEPCAEVTVGNKKYYPCCGEYIGAVTRSGTGGADPSGSVFEVVLVR